MARLFFVAGSAEIPVRIEREARREPAGNACL